MSLVTDDFDIEDDNGNLFLAPGAPDILINKGVYLEFRHEYNRRKDEFRELYNDK